MHGCFFALHGSPICAGAWATNTDRSSFGFGRRKLWNLDDLSASSPFKKVK